MNDITITPSTYDFGAMHKAVQRFVDDELIAGASAVVLKDNQVVDYHAWGQANIEAGQPIASDTIFRIYSNTKIVTTVAALCLLEDGCYQLDDPIEKYLPQLSDRKVLKAGSSDPSEVEDAASAPTVRQIMCHNGGFSYGIFAESPVDALYLEKNVMDPAGTLADMVDKLADIPLAYQPGARWQYSVSTDILARLVEVWSGQSFIEFLQARIFGPLGMVDTDFWVPADKAGRFAANYAPVNPMEPMTPGLNEAPDQLLGGYLEPKAFCSGGGGLVSTLVDYLRFFRMVVGDGELDGVRVLQPETVAMMRTNQLPEGVGVMLPNWPMPDTVFGLGLAIKTAPREGEPAGAAGEFHWGGMAGTHTWSSPATGISGLIFTQRLPGFWHEFSHEFKRQVYAACTDG